MNQAVNVLLVKWGLQNGMLVCDRLQQAERILENLEPGETDIILFPEGFLTKGIKHNHVSELAGVFEMERVETFFSKWALELSSFIAVPLVIKKKSQWYNTVCVFDGSGEICAQYDKLFPWPSDLANSRFEKGVTPGDKCSVFETPFGVVGIQTCFDVNFKTGWQQLVAAGAKLILFPSEYPGGFALQVRAWESGLPILAAILGQSSRVIEISGEELPAGDIFTLNLNKKLVHKDHQQEKIKRLLNSYPFISARELNGDNVLLIEAPADKDPLDIYLKELDIKTVHQYLAEYWKAIWK
jgi:predicted amidohydrolase